MTTDDLLRRLTETLETAGIPYMLTGSFASAYWGTPRATQDIDLVIAPTEGQVHRLVERLPTATYYVDLSAALDAYRRQSMFNVIDRATGWKVDLIIRKSRRFSLEEFSRRSRVQVQGTDLFIASAEDTIIAKLEWAKRGESLRQIEDVAGIVRVRSDLDLAYIEKWVRELDVGRQWDAARSPNPP